MQSWVPQKKLCPGLGDWQHCKFDIYSCPCTSSRRKVVNCQSWLQKKGKARRYEKGLTCSISVRVSWSVPDVTVLYITLQNLFIIFDIHMRTQCWKWFIHNKSMSVHVIKVYVVWSRDNSQSFSYYIWVKSTFCLKSISLSQVMDRDCPKLTSSRYWASGWSFSPGENLRDETMHP